MTRSHHHHHYKLIRPTASRGAHRRAGFGRGRDLHPPRETGCVFFMYPWNFDRRQAEYMFWDGWINVGAGAWHFITHATIVLSLSSPFHRLFTHRAPRPRHRPGPGRHRAGPGAGGVPERAVIRRPRYTSGRSSGVRRVGGRRHVQRAASGGQAGWLGGWGAHRSRSIFAFLPPPDSDAYKKCSHVACTHTHSVPPRGVWTW